MDFGNLLKLYQEIGLVAVFLVLLIYDIYASERAMKHFRLVACIVFGLHTLSGFVFSVAGNSVETAFGSMFVLSEMTVFMKNILNLAVWIVFLQAGQWLRSSKAIRQREGEFYTIMLASLLGMYFMISANNFMLLYISIEMASLPLSCLAAYDKYRERSAEAGAKYVLTTALSSGIMIFGISYLYGATGTMYFNDIVASIDNVLVLFGFVFFFAGIAFKISVAPFHLWTADVYEGSPTGVTAFFSVPSKAAASFTLIFILYRIFGNIETVWHNILWLLTVLTIVIGNLFALRQKNIKRFFAFSSISQAGYIMIGTMSEHGVTATIYYILVYLFSNLAVFGVITSIENSSQRTDISAYNGLYAKNPRLAVVMMLAVFSLAGIPPFAGFFSKFFIFASAFARNDYALVAIALANTVLSLYYYLLIVKAMFINPVDEQSVGRIHTDPYNRLSLALCTAGILIVGFLSGIYEYIGKLGGLQ
ncbi:MAG: NADH-quinone oxidoreductase subunit N [Prevotellaceae bacterium]|jgi:NADH-quinone oxidoreductase subunit N|nr:NADH-quinone oxidoreductase subunit N [Prevotellaceae bacterium]